MFRKAELKDAKKLYSKYFKLNTKNGIKEELIMYL